MEFLTWLENLSPVTWVRESDSLLGYTLYLAGHTIGLVFLIGPNLVIGARVLGLAPDLPLQPLAKFRPIMGAGLVLTTVTGLVLFATDPVNYVRNVVFLVKIASIVVAVLCLRGVVRGLFAPGANPDAQPIPTRIKQLTAASLLAWAVAVVAGRLTAYSGVVVFASIGAFLSTVIIATFAAGLFHFLRPRREPVRSGAFPLDVHPTPANGGK
jgi:hypothetical protein